MRAIAGLDDLPDLDPRAGWLLVLLVAVLWLALRVRILRARTARREPGEPTPDAARWLARLAEAPWSLPALLALGLVLALAIAWILS